MSLVPVAPFRKRFQELEERGEITFLDVAKRMGWERQLWDTTRARRLLGPFDSTDRPIVRVTAETAHRLEEVLGVRP